MAGRTHPHRPAGRELLDRLIPAGLHRFDGVERSGIYGEAWLATRTISGTPVRRGDILIASAIHRSRARRQEVCRAIRGAWEEVPRAGFRAILASLDHLEYIMGTWDNFPSVARPKEFWSRLPRYVHIAERNGNWNPKAPSPLIVIHNPVSRPVRADNDAAAIEALLRDVTGGAP